MSNVKSMNHQVGLNADPTKNITLSNDASGDLVVQRGNVDTALVEIGRFKNAGGQEYLSPQALGLWLLRCRGR